MTRGKFVKACALAILTIALAGCASTGTAPRTTASAAAPAIAPPPKAPLASLVPADYRAQVVAYATRTLKDPYSIKSAQISAPTSVFVGLLNGGNVPGVCVLMNAKNSFGAYIGVEPVVYAFKDGKIFFSAPPVFGGCSTETYGPFPELEQIT